MISALFCSFFGLLRPVVFDVFFTKATLKILNVL